MSRNLKRSVVPGLCALLVLASSTAADEVPNFKRKGDQEKKFVSQVCVAILKAAHPTGKNPSLDRFEYKEIKAGRSNLVLKGKFTGAVSRKEYVANITVHIDTTNKKSWEVLRIEYSDNASITYNRKNLDNLIKKFNDD